LVPYGNRETSTPHSSITTQVITMKHCTFDHVRKTNTCAKFGWNPRAMGRFTHTLLVTLLPALLPYCLFCFLRTCTGQMDRASFTQNGSKDAVWRDEVPSQQVFSYHLTFLGSFHPKTQTFCPQRGNPNQIKKSLITSKPIKIDKKCQVNMNKKSGSPF